MKTLVNLTPHAITIVDSNNNVIQKIEPSGMVARLKTFTENVGMLNDNIPITTTVFGPVQDLPEFNGSDIFIVSSLVAQVVNRSDVLIPNELVRDDSGNIIGCKSLGRI